MPSLPWLSAHFTEEQLAAVCILMHTWPKRIVSYYLRLQAFLLSFSQILSREGELSFMLPGLSSTGGHIRLNIWNFHHSLCYVEKSFTPIWFARIPHFVTLPPKDTGRTPLNPFIMFEGFWFAHDPGGSFQMQ